MVSPAPTVAEHVSARRRDVQGLRALAVVLVVAFHAGLPLPGGFIGVDVFFVISGFVITGMLAAERDRTGRVSLAAFYARRVRRILPALAVTIVAVAVFGVFLLNPMGPQQQTARTGAAASIFVANFQLASNPAGYFDATEVRNALLHTWSLSVEEQFYLVFPGVLAGAWFAASRSRRRSARRSRGTDGRLVLAVLAALSFAASWRLSGVLGAGPTSSSSARFAFYSSPTRAWEFLAGALIALSLPALRRISRPTAIAASTVGCVVIVWSAIHFTSATVFPGVAALAPVIGTALVIIGGSVTSSGCNALLGTTPAVRIGDLSYSWYLWHWPFIVFTLSVWPRASTVVVTAAASLSLVPAAASYALVERRFRFRTDLSGRRVIPFAACCIVVPLVVCLAVVPASRAGQSPETRALVESHRLHTDVGRGCDNLGPIGDRPDSCVWRVPDPKGTIYLVGDSNAEHFTEPSAAAANDLGYDFVADGTSGCSFVDLITIDGDVRSTACRQHVADTLAWLEAAAPSAVIVSSSTPGFIGTDSRSILDPNTGAVASTREEKLRMYQDGLTSVLDRLERAGIHTVLVHTIPQFDRWNPVICGIDVYLAPASCAIQEPRAEMEVQRRPTFEVEQGALEAVPAATGLDLTDDLCTPTVCSTRHDDVWYYRDGGHLSVSGSERLTSRFDAVLRSALATPTAVG